MERTHCLTSARSRLVGAGDAVDTTRTAADTPVRWAELQERREKWPQIRLELSTGLQRSCRPRSEEAGGFFAQCEAAESEPYCSGGRRGAPSRKAGELAEWFSSVLVRIAALLRESPMFGNPDLSAIQTAVPLVNASLVFRLYEEWKQEMILDRDKILGFRQTGFSEERRLVPSEAFAELKDAVDQVQRRIGVLRAG